MVGTNRATHKPPYGQRGGLRHFRAIFGWFFLNLQPIYTLMPHTWSDCNVLTLSGVCRIRGDRVAGSLPHPPLSNGATTERAEIPLVSTASAYMPATAAARPSGQPTVIRRTRMRPRAAPCRRFCHHSRLQNLCFGYLCFLLSFCYVSKEVAPINILRFVQGYLMLKTCFKTVFSNIYLVHYFIVNCLYISILIVIFVYHN